MNLCLADTFLVNDLFRCLCADLGVGFTAAPPVGKYTLELGESYAQGTLCPGLEAVLGSLTECRYLGADTAVIFAPCGNCSAQRIKSKLQNCLEQNGVGLNLICFEQEKRAQKSFWQMMKAVSGVSHLALREIQARFYDCADLSAHFASLGNRIGSDETLRRYLRAALAKIGAAQSLLDLKITLAVFTKRLAALRLPQAADLPRLPYSDHDYYALQTVCSKTALFETPSAENTALLPPCASDLSVFVKR